MNVKELIDILTELDPGLPVEVEQAEDGQTWTAYEVETRVNNPEMGSVAVITLTGVNMGGR